MDLKGGMFKRSWLGWEVEHVKSKWALSCSFTCSLSLAFVEAFGAEVWEEKIV